MKSGPKFTAFRKGEKSLENTNTFTGFWSGVTPFEVANVFVFSKGFSPFRKAVNFGPLFLFILQNSSNMNESYLRRMTPGFNLVKWMLKIFGKYKSLFYKM